MITRNTLKTVVILAFGLSVLNSYGFESVEDFDINTVDFVEDENELELGFDTTPYLPENFDPYSSVVSIESIDFIEESDEIDLGFETIGYLPKGFDPYIQ